MTIRHATAQLIALAAEVRGEAFATDLWDAMGIAAKNGWTFAQAGDYACRLIFRPDSVAKELIDASRGPLGPPPVPPASEEARLAAAEFARQQFAEHAAARAAARETEPDSEVSS